MNDYRALSPFRSLRWFFLIWLGAMYLWGFLNLLAGGKQPGNGLPNCTVIPAGSDSCILLYTRGLGGHVQAIILFY